uniref:Uncharacterized protein n=1 Tax=Tetraselmis sp. GSL018 TaxID=582737 RepID=A0A061SGU7_9CHLO
MVWPAICPPLPFPSALLPTPRVAAVPQKLHTRPRSPNKAFRGTGRCRDPGSG